MQVLWPLSSELSASCQGKRMEVPFARWVELLSHPGCCCWSRHIRIHCSTSVRVMELSWCLDFYVIQHVKIFNSLNFTISGCSHRVLRYVFQKGLLYHVFIWGSDLCVPFCKSYLPVRILTMDVEMAVALSYSPQIRDDAVPVDATDVNIDALVSSNGILTFSSQAEEQINSS